MTRQEAEVPHAGEYTIDELAARTGIPSRTIRFYQAKGVLPGPRKRGRVAVYDDSHAERLQIVGELQDKGLRLRAIRDIVVRNDLDRDVIHKWLGVSERLVALSQREPVLLSEDELKRQLGNPRPGLISLLVARERLKVQGEGPGRRYLVENPALLAIGRRMSEAGIDLETAITLQEILERRLARAAREVVDYLLKQIGHGFGKSGQPDDVLAAAEALISDGIGGEALRVIFIREVERALQEALQEGSATAVVQGRTRKR